MGGISVSGRVTNVRGKDISGWESLGLIKNVSIQTAQKENDLHFSYEVPVDQEVFFDTFKPVYNADFFCGFGKHLLVAPKITDQKFEYYELNLRAPTGWKLVTSQGVDQPSITLKQRHDFAGLMICAGEYSTHTFTLPNTGSRSPTQYILSLHGERGDIDETYFSTMTRLIEAQVAYFGGAHPADHQCIALHILGKGIQPSVPSFNMRVPAHDSILALHTPNRPWGHFEFFGMLSHEHMHNWFPNVLRSDLGPWFMEGLNDYVAYRILEESEIHTSEQFLGMLNKWHREYIWCTKQTSTPLMPYRQGMIAAWVFDLEIQRATKGEKGLKNLLQILLNETPKNERVGRSHFVNALHTLIGPSADALYKTLIESDTPIALPGY